MATKQARADEAVVSPPPSRRLILSNKDSGWLTAAEVAQFLNVSERQVQRYQTSRELRNLAYLRVSGRKPLTLYRLDEAQKIKVQLDQERRMIENRSALVLNATAMQKRVELEAVSGISEAVSGISKHFAEMAQENQALKAAILELLTRAKNVSILDKLLLTIKEARELGFPGEFLRERIRSGELKNFGSATRFLVARRDLAALAGGSRENGNGNQVHGALSSKERATLRALH